jgi:SWI/SNF-related matrix-associated actin-dependent regulator 1 of chromatin subfamily A
MPGLCSFQHIGAQFLAERNVAFLLDTMGLGKTAQAIRGADLVGAKSILVLCPAIARVNWQREFEKWQTMSRGISAIRSSAELPRQEDVLIVSYSMLASEKARRALLTRKYDVLICDEGHSLKEPRAVRTRAVYGSRINRPKGLASQSDRVWL